MILENLPVTESRYVLLNHLVLLLIVWAASIWTRPIGPVYWGVAWIPLFFIGLIFALLLAAIPTYDEDARTDIAEARRRDADVEVIEEEIVTDPAEIEARRDTDIAAAVAVGWIFWTFTIILFLAIIIGYVS